MPANWRSCPIPHGQSYSHYAMTVYQSTVWRTSRDVYYASFGRMSTDDDKGFYFTTIHSIFGTMCNHLYFSFYYGCYRQECEIFFSMKRYTASLKRKYKILMLLLHYSAVIWASWGLKSMATRLFGTFSSGYYQWKEFKAPFSWPFVEGINLNHPFTNGRHDANYTATGSKSLVALRRLWMTGMASLITGQSNVWSTGFFSDYNKGTSKVCLTGPLLGE